MGKIENWQFENPEDARNYIQYKFPQLQTLRQAALDGERYRKAGEKLVAFFENQFEGRDTDITQEEIELALKSYRQAVEQKEVPVSTLKVPYCNKCYPDHDHTRQETVEQKEV